MDRHPHLHPHRRLLSRFGRGRLHRRRNQEIVRHLLADCPDCRWLTSQLLPPLRTDERVERKIDRVPEPSRYGAAFVGARSEIERRSIALEAEWIEASELLRELLEQPFERQEALVAADGSRFQTWAFCELLLNTAGEWGFQDPGRARDLSQLGLGIAERLDSAVYGESRVSDIAARAWASLANAQRIRGDFLTAEKGFAEAERRLKAGTGDPVEKAQVLLLKASLYGNQQRFREAFRLLDRVVTLSRRCEDSHLWGKALVSRGFLLGLAGDPEAAIRHLTQGLQKVDTESDPRLVVAAQHNLTLYLAESGRYEEALRLLDGARPLYLQVGDQMSLLRLRWLEGKIASALGHFKEAEAFLRGVRTELIERELGYDAALLSLDLASIYAREGRTSEMRSLAEEMLPIFKSRDIHREAIVALFVFQKAAEMERVTLGLIQDVSGYLKESRAAWSLRSRESR
jgi:tetratricopeptide (TPR) repeat protein